MATDTTTTQLIVNKLTKAQFAAIEVKSATELYEITDCAHYTEAEMAQLLAAKQNLITADAKLDADLVNDTDSTNKFVTVTEKEAWNDKQAKITADAKLNADLVDDAEAEHKFVTADEKAEIAKIANKANDADVVKLTGDQTIEGTKTFTTIPVVGTADLSDNSTKAASTAFVAAAIAGFAPSGTTLAEYGITDAYTKTEVDSLVSAVYRYKGSFATYAELPTTGLTIGDVYNIEQADADNNIKAGDNVAWNGTSWDVLAGTVDVSGFAVKATTLAGYGITDAKIEGGMITLGANTITPLTADSTLAAEKLQGTAGIDITGTAAKATADAAGNVIAETYATKAEIEGVAKTADLAAVAFSGSYNDLVDAPEIPTVTFRQW